MLNNIKDGSYEKNNNKVEQGKELNIMTKRPA